MSQRKVTFNLATQALFYKKRTPYFGTVARFEDYEDGSRTGRAVNTIFYGSGREESPSPPPPPPPVAPMFVGCEPDDSPCPPPPPAPVAPPPLNIGGAAGGGGDLPPLKLTRYEYPLIEEEQVPSWNASPISPGTHKSWLDKRLEEASERKNALAAAYADFIGKATPPNQRTPASLCIDGSSSSRHMSPLNLTPRPLGDEGLMSVEEGVEDETEAALTAVCMKLKSGHL